jgi:hypothetical protein
MKKIIARISSEILYYLGDWISYPMHYFDWAWLYPIYNKLMMYSIDIQDWAKNDKPWRHTDEQTTI